MSPRPRTRTALIGGSFNPVTLHHTKIATELLRIEVVDEVWFVPAAKHPFRGIQTRKRQVAGFHDRVRMIHLAMKALPTEVRKSIEVCLVEDLYGLSGYTADTVETLSKQYPWRSFFWVVGTDCVNEFRRWKRISWLLDNVRFIVYPREGYTPNCDSDLWLTLQGDHIVLSANDVATSATSSTSARENPDKGLLDPQVAAYWKMLTG